MQLPPLASLRPTGGADLIPNNPEQKCVLQIHSEPFRIYQNLTIETTAFQLERMNHTWFVHLMPDRNENR